MKIRPPRYRLWRGSHLVLSVVVVVVAWILDLPAPPEQTSIWQSVVAFIQDYGWWIILLGIVAGEGGIRWVDSKESTIVTNALNAILKEFREELFGDASGQQGDHRVTLFQCRKMCWRVIWQRVRLPWGGWLLPVARPGHTSQRSRTVFRAPDNPSNLEGIAGKAWVLVLDSKQSHINGKRIGEEFRDLWRRSLRHMVAEL